MIKQQTLTHASQAKNHELKTWLTDKESLYRWGIQFLLF